MSSPAAPEKSSHSASAENEKDNVEQVSLASGQISSTDLAHYYEENAGSLVVDPEEAKLVFGEAAASHLKLSRDGTKVLWPQPSDDPHDPQNWSDRKKSIHLAIMTLAAIVPDFDSAIGIADLFTLSEQFNTTTGVINNLTSNWSIFLLGWGSVFTVMLMRKFGRLPVLFWSQLLALAFMLGCTFAPTLAGFAAFRCLTAFFGTCPQVTGLFVVSDMYPFHVQARKLNIWTMGFIISPFLSPFAFGFLAARASWRWAYGIASIYGFVVLLLIAFFMEETLFDRHLQSRPPRSEPHRRHRIETLLGLTGFRMSKLREPWRDAILAPFKIVWRPHLLSVLIWEAALFGFGIGINVTNAVFLNAKPPAGYGFSEDAISGSYGTPIVAVFIGEIIGRYLNDWIMNRSIKRNHGVFNAENRLWTCYISIPLYLAGFLVLGAAFQNQLSIAALVFGWGLAQVAIMIGTVAVYAYCNDCFPRFKGEISALVNLGRTLGGFAVAYFQVPWAEKHGALQTFGCEAAVVAGLFILIIPVIQIKGQYLRGKFGI